MPRGTSDRERPRLHARRRAPPDPPPPATSGLRLVPAGVVEPELGPAVGQRRGVEVLDEAERVVRLRRVLGPGVATAVQRQPLVGRERDRAGGVSPRRRSTGRRRRRSAATCPWWSRRRRCHGRRCGPARRCTLSPALQARGQVVVVVALEERAAAHRPAAELRAVHEEHVAAVDGDRERRGGRAPRAGRTVLRNRNQRFFSFGRASAPR